MYLDKAYDSHWCHTVLCNYTYKAVIARRKSVTACGWHEPPCASMHISLYITDTYASLCCLATKINTNTYKNMHFVFCFFDFH